MLLTHLSLINFKNCTDISIELNSSVNCFLGNNGEGKTNVLDAIYYLSNTKSYFNSIDSQNIKFGEPFFVAQGKFSINEETTNVYCGVKKGAKKQFKFNKKSYLKLAEHIGKFPVVIITPYDSNLILEGSETRRKFLDRLISQFNKPYLENLIAYNKLLNQRNATLKQMAESQRFNADLLAVIDMQLIEKGNFVHQERKQFLNEFIPIFNHFYKDISNQNEKVTLTYTSTLNDNSFEQLLNDNIAKDRVVTYTTKGIHKDDLEFKIMDDYSLKKFASQGQQKSFLIALKLAQFEYIKKKKGFSPILLLDDIFDKLDESRVNYILQMIAHKKLGQTFITDTSLNKVTNILSKLKVNFKSFEIKQGGATLITEDNQEL